MIKITLNWIKNHIELDKNFDLNFQYCNCEYNEPTSFLDLDSHRLLLFIIEIPALKTLYCKRLISNQTKILTKQHKNTNHQ